MRTTTAAASKAAQKSTSGRSGETQPGKITVTIDGALAEEIRKEAEITGMGPLSLLRQRIKLGNLVAQETAEAKAFRMDIAEKAFREAGRSFAPQNGDPTEVPEGCVLVRVRPSDARAICDWARTLPVKSPNWIVASVFAIIGEETLGDPEAAAGMKSNLAACAWRCIHRDEKKFTETIPVFFGDDLEHVAEIAKAMRRDLGDWLGTLIELGATVMSHRASLSFMTRGRELGLLASAVELESIKRAPAGAEEGGRS
jgi:hypothetical protein